MNPKWIISHTHDKLLPNCGLRCSTLTRNWQMISFLLYFYALYSFSKFALPGFCSAWIHLPLDFWAPGICWFLFRSIKKASFIVHNNSPNYLHLSSSFKRDYEDKPFLNTLLPFTVFIAFFQILHSCSIFKK